MEVILKEQVITEHVRKIPPTPILVILENSTVVYWGTLLSV